MAINQSMVTIGFGVAGLLMFSFGTVLVVVGPIIFDDQIIKVSLSNYCCFSLTDKVCLPVSTRLL